MDYLRYMDYPCYMDYLWYMDYLCYMDYLWYVDYLCYMDYLYKSLITKFNNKAFPGLYPMFSILISLLRGSRATQNSSGERFPETFLFWFWPADVFLRKLWRILYCLHCVAMYVCLLVPIYVAKQCMLTRRKAMYDDMYQRNVGWHRSKHRLTCCKAM